MVDWDGSTAQVFGQTFVRAGVDAERVFVGMLTSSRTGVRETDVRSGALVVIPPGENLAMAAILEPHRLPVLAPARRPDLRLVQGGLRPARPRSPFPVATAAALASFLIVLAVMLGAIAIGRGALSALAPAPGPPAAAAAPSSNGVTGSSVRVRAGDTIWSIARRLQPTGEVRPLVDRLVAANGSAAIRAGDRLIIPS